jgi:hypothetical protein
MQSQRGRSVILYTIYGNYLWSKLSVRSRCYTSRALYTGLSFCSWSALLFTVLVSLITTVLSNVLMHSEHTLSKLGPFSPVCDTSVNFSRVRKQSPGQQYVQKTINIKAGHFTLKGHVPSFATVHTPPLLAIRGGCDKSAARPSVPSS